MKLIKNNFQSRGIQPLAVLLDYPGALLLNEGILLLKQRAI